MCYIWVCVAYANNAQRERYLHAEGTLVIRRAYAQLGVRSLRARWYSLCIRTHTLCARYSNVSGTVWERYEHGARTLVPPNLIHTPGKLCVCGLLSYAQRTQNQYANIWRGLKELRCCCIYDNQTLKNINLLFVLLHHSFWFQLVYTLLGQHFPTFETTFFG